MDLISGAERNQLFERFWQDAFHLELRDDYSVPDEDGPFESWLRGEPNDTAFMEPWTQLVRQVTSRGMTVRRVRVVSEPHSSYIQWERETTDINIRAGESIRWLPRHEVPEGLTFPLEGRDWWLFDHRLLAVGHFNAQGRVLGSELIRDPEIVAECIRVRDLVWRVATQHTEYKP